MGYFQGFNLMDLVIPHLQHGLKLSKYKMVLMFLMKLCLNFPDRVITHQFGIHASTVSRNFHKVLDVMYICTTDFIKWPNRGVLRMTSHHLSESFFEDVL